MGAAELFIASIISLFILYFIIASATRAAKMETYMRIQNEILGRIAEKHGVTHQELKDIYTAFKIPYN